MPYKPKKPCATVGCPGLTHERYCSKCKIMMNQKENYSRGTAFQRGYDSRWRKARRIYLAKNPLCVKCMETEKLTPAAVVDHIIPHKGNPELFWDTDNWQSLCTLHHNIKTVMEDGGFGRQKEEIRNER